MHEFISRPVRDATTTSEKMPAPEYDNQSARSGIRSAYALPVVFLASTNMAAIAYLFVNNFLQNNPYV